MTHEIIKRQLDRLYEPGTAADDILAFCRHIIQRIEAKQLSLAEGAFYIAGLIGHPLWSDDAQLTEIASLAAELEIPADSRAATPKRDAKYHELKGLIASYKKTPSHAADPGSIGHNES